jgi:hypothetical protein
MKLEQKTVFDLLKEKGHDLKSPVYQTVMDFSTYMINYKFTLNYINGSTKEDIENMDHYSFDVLIEPIILPSLSNSLFISMYGDFEYHLSQLCHAYQLHKKLKICLSDIYGNGIYKAATYLDKVVGLNIKNSKEWSRMVDWNRVRNALVHNSGYLKDKEVDSANRLNLNINQEHGKFRVYFTLKDCLTFYNEIPDFIKMCIA